MAEPSGSPSVHRCPHGNPRCGRWRRLLGSAAPRWFCSRCCELLAAARDRALDEEEINELATIVAEQAESDRQAAAA